MSANADWDVDAHQHGVEVVTWVVVRGVIAADEGGKAGQFFHALHVAHRAVVDDTVARVGVDGVGQVIAHRGAVFVGTMLVSDVHVAGLEFVDGPGILSPNTSFGVALCRRWPGARRADRA